ncbi:hypothetical protein A8B78_06750 [Jannaschia sp. EhC01]|nr:hypothetical protein A8B78_06750 [Jannaschia sp. EhC01]
MPDTLAPTDSRHAWLRHLGRIGADHGFFDRLSARHMALFVDEGDTLVLSFDRADRTWDQGDAGLPLGFDCVRALEVSLLSILSIGRTWFRDPGVEDLLETLAKEGFFDSYAQVLILATGPDCGHAAARAARHVPGARVLLSRPAAAISATHAPFERRFTNDRASDPDTPLPLGPEALQSAATTTILFDPTRAPEAAQAALFRAPGTTRIALPHTGPALDRAVARGEALVPLTRHLAADTLTAQTTREVLRPILRRDHGYLARLAQAAETSGHPERAARITTTGSQRPKARPRPR